MITKQHQPQPRRHSVPARAKSAVAEHAVSSAAVGFGLGFGVGLLIGLSLSESGDFGLHDRNVSRSYGRRLADAMSHAIPESFLRRS